MTEPTEPEKTAPTEKVAAPTEKVAAPTEKVAAPTEKVAAPTEKVAAPTQGIASGGRAAEPTVEFGAPEATQVIPPLQEQAPRSMIVALTFIVVAAATFLVGIAVASSMRDGPSAGVVVAAQQVGTTGATVRFDGGEIRIPAGALSAPARIVVRRTVVAERVRVRPPGGRVQVFDNRELVAYVFEPRNLDFLRPVTILFRLTDRSGGAAAFARVGEATLLLGGKVDTDRATLEVETSDFRFTRGVPIGADE